jgi:hypothetical protein
MLSVTEARHAEIGDSVLDRRQAHRIQLLLRRSQGGLDRGDFAEPALFLGLIEPVDQIGVELLQSWQLAWVDPK